MTDRNARCWKRLSEAGPEQVTFAGHLSGAALDNAIARSQFTVFPSRAYETMGKSILESYAQARAVVASDLGHDGNWFTKAELAFCTRSKISANFLQRSRFCMRTRELARKMGEEGHELVKTKPLTTQHFEELERIYAKRW